MADSQNTPAIEAQRDAKTIRETLDKSGTSTAYEVMLSEIQAAKEDPKTFSEYRVNLTKSLEKENVLPSLSLEWGRRAAEKVSPGSNGVLDSANLSPYADGKVPVDELTQSMAGNLRKHIGSHTVTTDELKLQQQSLDQARQNAAGESRAAKESLTAAGFLTAERKEYNGRSLHELADAAGGKVDGKVGKEDIQTLIDNQLLPLDEDDQNYLKNMLNNWDKPNVTRLRDSDGYITSTSLGKASSEPKASGGHVEQQNTKDDSKAAAAAGVTRDYLTEKNPDKYNGKSLLELADVAGGKEDGKVGKNDIDNLLKSKLVTLDEDDSAFLKNLSDNWDKPEGQRLISDEGYVTTDSLEKAAQDKLKVQNEQATETRVQQGAIAKMLLQPGVGAGNLSVFQAADIAGGTEDQLIGRQDLKALMDNKLVTLSEEQRTLVKELYDRWDEPTVSALRNGSEHLSADVLKAASF